MEQRRPILARPRAEAAAIRARTVFRAFTAIVAAGLLAVAFVPPANAAISGTATASQVLAELAVAAPVTSGYDRDLFQHWIDEDSDGCDTRQEVLAEESQTAVVYGTGCTVLEGTWFSWYDAQTWTDPADVDIDHFVPLGEAWKSGANAWTADQRRAFANDLGFADSLVAATDNVNQSKSDSDPAAWLPPDAGTHCRYAVAWVTVKYRWSLTVDAAEQSTLSSLLADECGATEVVVPAIMIEPATPPEPPAPPITAPASFPVYRFWSPVYNAHFYTISVAERDQVVQKYPGVWNYEGQKYRAFTTQVPGAVPLYRFWSDTLGGHFYTVSETEKQYVINAYDDSVWRYERVAYYVYPVATQVTGSASVARFWSDTFMHHFYTASATEANIVKTTYAPYIWRYEREAFRVMPAANMPGDAPPPAPPAPPPPPPPPSVPANPGNTKNCDDFATWAQANDWFQTYYPHYGDIAQLDADNDLVPCESLLP